MKGILGCCYQCDVPPETIQNLRISWLRNRLYLHMVYLLTQCATTTRKIFLFFFGWAHPERSSFFWVGPPRRLKLPSCQEIYFYWPA